MLAREGCIICGSAAQIHHMMRPRHRYQFLVLPLCEGCHTGYEDKSKLAFHKAKATWRHAYGHEAELYFRMRGQLNEVGKWPEQIENDLVGWLNSGYADRIYLEQSVCHI